MKKHNSLAAGQDAMRNKNPPRTRGRAALVIDPRLVTRLAAEGYNTAQIARFIGCHPRTLQRRVRAALRRGQALWSVPAKLAIMEEARAGNRSALLLLGRKYLKYDK